MIDGTQRSNFFSSMKPRQDMQGLGTLGDLGKCDWNNPCSDRDKVIYRLEYYTLVWFEHAGEWFGQKIDASQYLIIIYQSWLQLMMQEQKQDKSGPMYKKFAVFGDQYFIMFGGSEDSRAKAGSNKYYADARMNGKCYEFLNWIFWKRDCSSGIMSPLCAAIDYFVKEKIDLLTFISLAYSYEVNFYHARIDCEHPVSLWGDMLRLWLDPIGAIVDVFKKFSQNDPLHAALATKANIDIEKQIIKPIRDNDEAAFRNQALLWGGFGVAGMAMAIVLFKATSKDGSLKWWQWGLIGGAGVIGGRKILQKYSQKSTAYKSPV
jgi:hypothetical protein